MNKMFRKPDQGAVRHDNFIQAGVTDWEARVNQAMASQTSWKTALFMTVAVLGGSVAGNIWLAAQSKVQVIHVVHDSIGGVINVSASTDPAGGPTQLMLKAAIEEWITNVRTVYIDVLAMRRSVLAAYAVVADKSQASTALTAFYQGVDKFKRAETETVAVQDVVAVPPTSSDIGPGGQQTWAVSWNELVMGRDGTVLSFSRWSANVTFHLDEPTSIAEATRNPNGVHIVSYSWTGGPK